MIYFLNRFNGLAIRKMEYVPCDSESHLTSNFKSSFNFIHIRSESHMIDYIKNC